MKKSTRIVKKFIAAFLIVLMSIENFAAVVGDNDGAAFITKAEFDSLKNNFQSQIDQYNTSIDSKIDGAIASYLAGIKVDKKTILDSLLNKCNCEFNKDWAIPTTQKGDKYRAWIHVGALIVHGGAVFNNTKGITHGIIGEAKVSNKDGQSGGWKYYGTNDGQFVVLKEANTIGCRYPDYFINSVPYSAVEVYRAEFNVIQVTSGWAAIVDNFEITAGSLTDWGMSTATVNIYWDTTKTTNTPASGVTVFQPGDTRTDQTWMTTLPGTEYSTTEDILYVNSLDIQKINKDSTNGIIGYGKSTVGYRSHVTYSNPTTSVQPLTITTRVMNGESHSADAQKIAVYRHVYWTGNMDDMSMPNTSQIMQKKVLYSEGCPIFEATANGNVKFKLKFVNNKGKKTKFTIKEDSFNNVTVTAGASATLQNVICNNWEPNNNSEVEISFDVKKGKTYWIKALPESGITKITSVDDIVLTEE